MTAETTQHTTHIANSGQWVLWRCTCGRHGLPTSVVSRARREAAEHERRGGDV